MLFSTFDYFLFLPLVAVGHWMLGGKGARATFLLVTSAVFYAAWNAPDALILAWVATAGFVASHTLGRLPERWRTPLLWLAAAAMLGPLCFYKYAHFGLSNVAVLIPGIEPWVPPKGHLPIGISFYSFQALAYVIDVRRGETPERDPIRYATFLCFFPHLVAGPILRSSTLLAQLGQERHLSRADVGYACWRLGVGLIKKLLVADVLQQGIVDSVFTDPGAFTGLEVLVALYAYTLQIYADFSGYTDFAIGSSRLLGFHIPENFERPYQATSVADYWRRWHKTLSNWVRDYVYYPLGGSRGAGIVPYRNTMVTLVILGVWHGANWTFIVYGTLHGLAVSLNRWWRKRPGWAEPRGPLALGWRWALTFQFVVTARILFRADDLTQAGTIVDALTSRWDDLSLPRYSFHAWGVLFVGYAVHFTPRAWVERARERFITLPAPVWGVVLAVTGWATIRYGVGDSLAFIYYAF
ncbi:MAG: MBOAT family protein [Myxococcales bacterium]|nr:MBOAT family protein [Myxococcales bacterium]